MLYVYNNITRHIVILCVQVTAEHGVIQRGHFMVPKGTGDSHTQRPPDVEDVCITTSSANATAIHQVQENLQLARKKLAAKKKDVNMVILSFALFINNIVCYTVGTPWWYMAQ